LVKVMKTQMHWSRILTRSYGGQTYIRSSKAQCCRKKFIEAPALQAQSYKWIL